MNDKIRGAMLLYVMFHELAHHLFHFPSNTSFGAEFFTLDSKKKNHFEAEAAAAVGAKPMLVLTGKGEKTQREALPEGTLIFTDLAAAIEYVLKK